MRTAIMVARACCAIIALTAFLASGAAAQEVPGPAKQQFDEIVNAIIDGQYARAAELARDIIEQNRESGEISIRAYNHLLWVLFEQAVGVTDPVEQERLSAVIRGVAREALLRYPTIRAGDEVGSPFSINEKYQAEREKLFGQLQITTEPDSAIVFINNEELGISPYFEEYYLAATCTLRVSREGFNDYIEEILVEPNKTNSFPIVLSRHRGRWWWLSRVGAPVVAVAGVVTALVVGGDEPTEEELPPLPGPPQPPD